MYLTIICLSLSNNSVQTSFDSLKIVLACLGLAPLPLT